MRFEIDKENGVRCDANGQIDDASRVLTKNWKDNHSRLEQPAIARRQKDSRRTDDAKISETNGIHDDSGIIGKKPAIVDIVQYLVESR